MGLLGSFFNFVDPILDKIDPMHNKVQTWTTGSSETEGQRPYFETIAPMIVDAFLPGVGSAVGAVDKASTGNWTGAGISALGAMYGLGSLGSTGSSAGSGLTAAEGAGVGASNAGADAAGSGLTLSSGQGLSGGDYSTFAGADSYGSLSGSVSSGSPELASMSATGASDYSKLASADRAIEVPNTATGSQPGANWKYYDNGVAISPEGRYYMNGEMVTGAGGQSKGILDYATEYGGKAGRFINGKDAQQAMKIGAAGMATDQKLRAQQAMKQQQMMPRPVEAPDWGANSGRQVRSFQELSPYQNFNGGFNPRRMSRSGLLG